MPWPLSQDYNEAIQNPDQCFNDPELQQGQALTNALGLPMPCSGNFADVYAIQAGSRKWAVKCFTRQVPGLRDRYAEISRYLQQVDLPFMVDFHYLDPGIRVHGLWYPVLKMDWVDGCALNGFVKQNADQPATLEALGDIWLKLSRRLVKAQVAHGDLQHGNVLLVPADRASALSVRLIDYDGMWVPALARARSGEVGHPAYQHPLRLREGTYSADVDRFAHLVIYTALRALMVGGRPLWDRYDNGDNLLFRQQDLAEPARSPLFKELSGLDDGEVRTLANHLSRAVYKPLDQVPPLDAVVREPVAGTSPRTRKREPVNGITADTLTRAGEATRSRKRSWKLSAGLASVFLVIVGVVAWLIYREPPPPAPAIAIQPIPDVTLSPGEDKTLAVRLTRTRYNGPIRVELQRLPPGVSAAPATVATGQNTVQVRLTAASQTAATRGRFQVVAQAGELGARGEASITVQPSAPDAPVLLPIPDLVLHPGESKHLTVGVKRNGFQAPIGVTIEGLPNKVTAPRAAIGTGKSEVQVLVSAAPDTESQEVTFQVVAAAGRWTGRCPGKLTVPGPSGAPMPFMRFSRYTWARGKDKVKLIGNDQGFCFLSSLSGHFAGDAEEIQVRQENGWWYLSGRTAQPLGGGAMSVQGPVRQLFRADVQEGIWTKGSATKLLAVDDGVCVLSSVGGGFHSPYEEVRLFLGADRYWYLQGKHARKRRVWAKALILRTRKPGSLPATFTEHSWKRGEGRVKMIHQSEGLCFLSGVGGNFAGDGEEVNVSIGEDGYWYLGGRSGTKVLHAHAISIRFARTAMQTPRRLPELIRDLRSPNAEVRTSTVSELGNLGPAAASASAALAEVLANAEEEERIRVQAAEALGKIGPAAHDTYPALLAAAADAGASLGRACLTALGQVGPPTAADLPALTEALKSGNPAVRAFVVDVAARARLEAPAIVPLFRQALRDREKGIRLSAARALGKLSTEARTAAVELAEALKDSDQEVAIEAAAALGKIGPQAAAAVPALADALNDADVRVRSRAVDALGKLGSAAKPAVPALGKRLTLPGEPIDVRRRILAALKALGPDAGAALPALVRVLLYDEDLGVPPVARKVDKTDKNSVEAFSRLLSDLAVVQVLQKIGKPAVGSLGNVLGTDNANLRLAAVIILGNMGAEARDAIPALQLRAKNDTFPEIRTAASAALVKIGNR